MVMPQLLRHVTVFTGDTAFHYSRFYDVAQQIKHGTFNYFQINYAFNESGRIINAVYGPGFAYFNGLLLLILGNWFKYQMFTEILSFCISGIGMYLLARKVKVTPVFALILSVLFMNVGLATAWVEGFLQAWGAALAPFALMQGVNMLQDKERPIHSVPLMLIMSLISEIHVLSTLMFVLMLIPFAIGGFIISNDKKQMLIEALKAVTGTLVLTANVWAAFLVLSPHNHLAIPGSFDMVQNALIIGPLRSALNKITIWLVGLLILQIIYVLFTWKKSLLNTITTLSGALLLFISSRHFPWAIIEHRFHFLTMSFQFPYRLTAIAYPLLFLGIAITVSQLVSKPLLTYKTNYAVGAILIAVFSLALIDSYKTDRVYVGMYGWRMEQQNDARSTNMKTYLVKDVTLNTRDYLPIYHSNQDANISAIYQKQIVEQSKNFNHKVLHDGSLQLTWIGKSVKNIRLPIVIVYSISIAGE